MDCSNFELHIYISILYNVLYMIIIKVFYDNKMNL